MRRIKDILRCMEIIRIHVGENGILRTHWTKGENRMKYEGVEGYGCHERMLRKDVTEGCHGRMSQKDATEGCHGRMPQKDFTEGGHGWMSRKEEVYTREQKREGGYPFPDEINAWIIFV